jgi:hypothetical protein
VESEKAPERQQYDVFISHAGEDKDEIARPLARALEVRGLRVWYDEWTLRMGSPLRRTIDEGLRDSRFGVVVLSKHFFAKRWPTHELDGLVSLEADGVYRILPVWHLVSHEDVCAFSPMLADRIAGSTTVGIDLLADEIVDVVRSAANAPTSEKVTATSEPNGPSAAHGAAIGMTPTVRTDPRYGGRDAMSRTAGLVVENLGRGRLIGVEGRIAAVRRGGTEPTGVFPGLLQWSSSEGGGCRLDIATQAFLDVAVWESPYSQAFLFVWCKPELRRRMTDITEYEIDIEVSAENAATVRRTYRLKMESDLVQVAPDEYSKFGTSNWIPRVHFTEQSGP